MRCASCGYLEAYHDLGTLRCPIETADRAGHRGSFKVRPPLAARHPWFGGPPVDRGAKMEEALPEEVLPPLVPARLPWGPAEYAGGDGNKQATKLGRAAAERGWMAQPAYWRSATGDEGCAVQLAKGPLRAVATWKRPVADFGKLTGWKVDCAYAWRVDVARIPTKLTHTELEGLIK